MTKVTNCMTPTVLRAGEHALPFLGRGDFRCMARSQGTAARRRSSATLRTVRCRKATKQGAKSVRPMHSYDEHINLADKPTEIRDGLGNKVVYRYDSEGNRIHEGIMDPDGNLKKSLDSVYDTHNRLQRIVNPDRSHISSILMTAKGTAPA
jgi:YD repeat-containing protein